MVIEGVKLGQRPALAKRQRIVARGRTGRPVMDRQRRQPGFRGPRRIELDLARRSVELAVRIGNMRNF